MTLDAKHVEIIEKSLADLTSGRLHAYVEDGSFMGWFTLIFKWG